MASVFKVISLGCLVTQIPCVMYIPQLRELNHVTMMNHVGHFVNVKVSHVLEFQRYAVLSVIAMERAIISIQRTV